MNTELNYQFAIIVSDFNTEITTELLNGTLSRLAAYAKQTDAEKINYAVFHVPGAVEIPLIAQTLARQQQPDAIICLGAVIRGETTHYDYVCEQVSNGCQRVALDHHLPVIFGVLTTENETQAWDRLGGKHGHKGHDAADAAIHMSQLLRQLTQKSS
jgi:6,7-dimethyl-8-ribityllumazine synthase